MSSRVNLIAFWLGPIKKLFISGVHFTLRWILRFLGPIFFCKLSIKTFQIAHRNLDFSIQKYGT